MIYETIYKRLERLGVIPLLAQGRQNGRSVSSPFMDLTFDLVTERKDYVIVALSHHYEQRGDLVPDPDMTIRIFNETGMAEALTYQDSMSFQSVYDDTMTKFDPKLKVELNRFLNYWLGNLLKQKHSFTRRK